MDTQKTLWDAIVEVIHGLRREPILLFGLGLAILFLVAGGLALENLRTIAFSLLALLCIVLATWILLQAMNSRSESTTSKRMHGGDVSLDTKVELDGAEVEAGSVKATNSVQAVEADGGNVSIGTGSKIKKSKLRGGDVTIDQ